MGTISWAIDVNRTQARTNTKPMGMISACMIQLEHIYTLAVIKVTDLFEVLMLQIKVNRRNYTSHAIIYITWLG